MANNSSSALAATLVMMIVLCPKFEFVVANNDPNFHFHFPFRLRVQCAIKCAASCLELPTIPLKVACSTACLAVCLHKSSPSDEVNICSLDCANSGGEKFFSDGSKKLDTYKDVETLEGFVDVCYDKCKKKAD